MISLIESDKNLTPDRIRNKTLIIWGEKIKLLHCRMGKS